MIKARIRKPYKNPLKNKRGREGGALHFRRLCYRKAAPPSPMTDNKDVCKRIAPINRTVLFWSHRSDSTGTIETIEAWSHKLLCVALAASLGGETEIFQRLHHSLNMKDTLFSSVAASDVVGSFVSQTITVCGGLSPFRMCAVFNCALKSMSWHGHISVMYPACGLVENSHFTTAPPGQPPARKECPKTRHLALLPCTLPS